MLQHQHERARSDAIKRLPYVGSLWLVIVLCTSHIDAVSASMHRHMLIHQQAPSATPLEVLHPLLEHSYLLLVIYIHIIGVIVIAQHTHHAVSGFQTAEQRLILRQFIGRNIL